jgi:hypothetical protein
VRRRERERREEGGENRGEVRRGKREQTDRLNRKTDLTDRRESDSARLSFPDRKSPIRSDPINNNA